MSSTRTCCLQRGQLAGQREAICCDSHCIYSWQCSQRCRQIYQVSAQRGLAPCQPDLVHTSACEDARLQDTEMSPQGRSCQ